MTRGRFWEHLATGLLVACAVVTSGAAVYRQAKGPVGERRPGNTSVKEWQALVANAIPVAQSHATAGGAGSAITLVEFADYQCPFCAQMHDSLKTLLKRTPHRVRYLYANFPLTAIHPHAYRAALVVGCAAEQGRTVAMMDELYRHQKEIGRTTWSGMATRAEVPDTSALQACMKAQEHRRGIEETVRIGKAAGVSGTPTFAVNGVLLGSVRTLGALEAYLNTVKQ